MRGMPLDVPTILIVVTTVALLLAFWTCVMAWGEPAGDSQWAIALALCAYATSNLLFALQGRNPTAVSVSLGNLAYALTLALMLRAVRRFQGAPANIWLLCVPVIVIPPLTGLLVEHFRWRAVMSSALFTVQIGFVIHALLDRRHPIKGRGRYILLASFVALAVTLVLRGVALGLGWLGVAASGQASNLQAQIFLIATSAVTSIAFGFIYMHMERAERRNFELAMQDALTGLANRRAISEELTGAVARAQRQGRLLSLLVLDVDHFKRINDGYGHQAGDAVLHAVAQTLKSRLRAGDCIGRFGGEEFLVVLPDTGLDGALTLAEALRAAVEATPVNWGAHSLPVTISIGASGGPITGSSTADQLVAVADAAMYRAKESGRNRVAA